MSRSTRADPVSTLFSGPPKPPPIPPPQPMPDLLDPAIATARRRTLQAAIARSGRLSTILSGGDEYSGDTLGKR